MNPFREASNADEMRKIIAMQMKFVSSAPLVCRLPYELEEGSIIEASMFANEPIWFLVRNCFLRILDLSLRAFELFEHIDYEP